MTAKKRPGYVGRNMKKLADKTHTFICITDYVRSLVAGYNVAEEKLARIYCSTNVDVEKEYPSSLREELGYDLETTVVGTTGIWRPNKGFPHFIAAGEMIVKWNPMVKFVLGGKAYSQDASFASSLVMRGRVLRALNALEYTGFQPDVGRFMSALDIFVLPSDCEPFGLVTIEAMARGIPVVGTDSGGTPEIIRHGENGYLVPPRNAKAIAEAVYDLICNPVKRIQMGETAKLYVRKIFNQKNMVKSYESLYLNIIEGNL